MGRLFEGIVEIDRVIAARGLDAVRTKGRIGMKAGIFLDMIFPDTPDDPDKIERLREAAEDVLGTSINI